MNKREGEADDDLAIRFDRQTSDESCVLVQKRYEQEVNQENATNAARVMELSEWPKSVLKQRKGVKWGGTCLCEDGSSYGDGG